MKRFFYFLPVAALALASCSNNDDNAIVKGGDEIAQALAPDALQLFPVVSNATTRAFEELTNDKFVEFKINVSGTDAFVTGVTDETPQGNAKTIANGTTVKKESGKWSIMENDEKVSIWWKNKNAKSSFTAYNQAAGSFSTTNQDNVKDVMVAAAPLKSGGDYKNGVPLTFRHTLSQVVVKAYNAAADNGITIKVKAARLRNIGSTSTLSLPSAGSDTSESLGYNPWSAPSETSDFNNFDATAEATTLSTATVAVLNTQVMIPQTLACTSDQFASGEGAYLSLLINVKDATGDNTVQIYPSKYVDDVESYTDDDFAWAAVNLDGYEWEPGKKYTITLKFAKDGYGSVDAEQTNGKTPAKDGKNSGDPIVDNPLPLIFTVSVVDWEDAAAAEDIEA